jgi:hypothetical protein
MCYNSVWLMFDCHWYILPMLPLSISEKEKLGKPKDEIGNLKMDLNICILMISKCNICKLNICILVILRYNDVSNLNILCIHISYFCGHNTTSHSQNIRRVQREAMGPKHESIYGSRKSHERCSRLNLGPNVPMEVTAGRVRTRDCLY